MKKFTAAFLGLGLGVAACTAGAAAAPKSTDTARPPAVSVADRTQLAAQVRAELLFSWQAYERYAWGHDELRPLSRNGRDWYGASLYLTPVDALDALLLLGCKAEAEKAKGLILAKLSFDQDVVVKNFEITIRVLGGLLSSYQLSGDARLLRLAEDLGTRLLPAFESPTGMPYMFVNLRTGAVSGPRSNPAEIGTLLLEFGTLSKLTKNPLFYEKAKRALVQLHERRSKLGLVGEEIDVETGAWTSRASHLGGGIDSYYEYLLKCSLLFGDTDCERMWQASRRALDEVLADEVKGQLWYGQADMETGLRTATEFGALHAFFPAVLALAGDLERARRLQTSCYSMWALHGIEPEVFDYRTRQVVHAGYPLRPEIMESAFTLHRATQDGSYLEMGRAFLSGLTTHCRTEAGYTTLKDVVTKEKGDLMPSYFLAETLKYLYLLFTPEPLPALDGAVFNTEAHPLRRTW